MTCLSDTQILSFVRGMLGPDERARMEQHLSGCADCRFLVAQGATYFMPEGAATVNAPGAAEQPALPPGTTLHRYVIEERIGSGGGGTVYRALDPQLRRKVAIKLLRPTSSPGISTDQAYTRLLHEAQAMAQLSHPNVVSVHDTGTFQDDVFIVMELVDGQTMRSWLKAHKRSWPEVVRMFLAAGQGLAAAHAARLVHRDFKPGNVLIGLDGRPRVTDFGLARSIEFSAATEPSSSMNLAVPPGGAPNTAIAGTPGYMAPEQFQGKLVDARTDQFCFCVALFQALCDYHPFVGQQPDTVSVRDLARRVAEGKLISPPAALGLPDWLTSALMRGLQIDPRQRYPSLEDLLAALVGPQAEPGRRAWYRRRSIMLGVPVLAAATGTLLWGALFEARCGDGQRDQGEECDDGNASDADACLPGCRWARCGDGKVRAQVEECDDGGRGQGGACSNTCLRCPEPDAFSWAENGHCYSRHLVPRTWSAARRSCEDLGGNLVTYTSTPEGGMVLTRLLGDVSEGIWIGLVNVATPGKHAWVTGEPALEAPMPRWGKGEPRHQGGSGTCYYESPAHPFWDPGRALNGGLWFSSDCEERRPFVCERTGWAMRPVDNHAYRVVHRMGTWHESRTACEALGGHLATIDDADENAFVSSVCPASCWMGATDLRREGQFEWVTGAPFRFRAFGPREPDDHDGDYDCMALGPDDLWHDRRCSQSNAAVCEIE